MTFNKEGKAAIFVVLFLMSLSLHIQFPIFTPYAATLGATSVFISILLSTSSLANMIGHVISGPFIDRIGKKPFIVIPLLGSSILMFAYGLTNSPTSLFVFRFINSFVLAFLMPAGFALLSSYAKSSREQGKNMAINGLLVTIANIIAPLIGGYLVEYAGYQKTYFLISVLLLISSIIALLFIQENMAIVAVNKDHLHLKNILLKKELFPIYLVAFALMYGQGTILYEIPLLVVEHGWSNALTGKLFSLMGIGTLAILMMFWLNMISSLIRTMMGMVIVGLCFYQLGMPIFPFSLDGTFLLLGVGFGMLFPAITTLVTETIDKTKHGTAFGILSAVFSLGMVISPLVAGFIRHYISSYFIAFLITMTSVLILGWNGLNLMKKKKAI